MGDEILFQYSKVFESSLLKKNPTTQNQNKTQKDSNYVLIFKKVSVTPHEHFIICSRPYDSSIHYFLLTVITQRADSFLMSVCSTPKFFGKKKDEYRKELPHLNSTIVVCLYFFSSFSLRSHIPFTYTYIYKNFTHSYFFKLKDKFKETIINENGIPLCDFQNCLPVCNKSKFIHMLSFITSF